MAYREKYYQVLFIRRSSEKVNGFILSKVEKCNNYLKNVSKLTISKNNNF